MECANCGGSGMLDGSAETCPHCCGSGIEPSEDRALLLVQVLASNAGDEGLLALCEAWGVKPARDESFPQVHYRHETVRALAKAALAHGREEGT